MAGDSLKAALLVNVSIGIIKTIIGLITGSAAMIAEAYHSFADSFNQILLALGIRGSKKQPDLEHPFGYKKVQFFWAFIVAVLIFGVSGTLAVYEGISILLGEAHQVDTEIGVFGWQLAVLAIAAVLEGFALRTALREANEYRYEVGSESLLGAVQEMQDPVLMSLLVEDSLALAGLLIAFIGSVITFITHNPVIDGITSLIIGIVLMIGGILLAKENQTYLVGKSVSWRLQSQIKAVVDANPSVAEVRQMKTMLMGPDDLILVLDIVFTASSKMEGEIGTADDIDQLEQELIAAIPILKADHIFIESQLQELPESS